MIHSKYTKHPKSWPDRIQAMKEDIARGEYSYLYFKIALNYNDAKDNADYDRVKILKEMIPAVKLANDPDGVAVADKKLLAGIKLLEAIK